MIASVLARLGLPPAARTQPMSGYDAEVWRADLMDGRTVAVRVLRRGVASDREVAALRRARDRGQPVPAVLATGAYDGREVVVMTWCAGRTIGELLVAGGDPHRLGRLFGQAQGVLHRPDEHGQVLCHLDFQPFNVLVDDGAVTGIVDWSNARTDDRRADLAWTRAVLAFAPALVPRFAAIRDRFEAAWRAGYESQRPMPDDAELAPFLAVAAHRQLTDWVPRVSSGACPPQVLEAVEAVARRWPL